MNSNTEALVNGQVVNDETWFKLFIPVFIWLVFWLIEMVSGIIYFHGYWGYPSIVFFAAIGFLLVGIFTKNGFLYRVGFYIYLVYAIAMIIFEFLLIIFIWFLTTVISEMIGYTLNEASKTGTNTEEAEKAGNALNWAFIGIQIFITLVLGICILIEVCFLLVLKRRIPYFTAYEQYKLRNLQPSSPI